ncbi:hypothetical protein C8J56DRAFT_890165 [Mycena floridula]|nr:hypothetical protein C8J56DRAFT_890165 [Mycena floridula]
MRMAVKILLLVFGTGRWAKLSLPLPLAPKTHHYSVPTEKNTTAQGCSIAIDFGPTWVTLGKLVLSETCIQTKPVESQDFRDTDSALNKQSFKRFLALYSPDEMTYSRLEPKACTTRSMMAWVFWRVD